ncbi:MAG: hypothetical protein P8M22_03325 [Phycisphaerales bacterium]|nr:hypothetical protein [Phycisphaerales bacterium]
MGHLTRFFLISSGLAVFGCSSGPPTAPPVDYVFTGSQARQSKGVLRSMALESPKNPDITLDLVPADGVRWETLEDAVDFAVGVPEFEMAVNRRVDVSETEQVFYLVDSHMWPARVTVMRLEGSKGIEVEVVMGPDPSTPGNLRKAEAIRKRVLAAIDQYGRIRRVPAYRISSRPGEVDAN